MKIKKIIIISVILIVVGIATAFTGLAIAGFNFGELDGSAISKTYDIDSNFESIECEMEVSDLNFYLTTDDKNYALCLEKDNITFDVKVIDNVLTIKENYKFKPMIFENTEVSLYLNKDTIQNLNIKTDTGDICILDQFKFNNIKIEGSTNDVEFMGIVSNEININLTTGDVWSDKIVTNNMSVIVSTGDIDITNSKINNNLNIKISTGEVELRNIEIVNDLTSKGTTGDFNLEYITCNNINLTYTTGDVELNDVVARGNMNIETDTGDVELIHSDASNIYITTDTGKVEGSILTDKKFDAKSDTGKVTVPNVNSGGICKIRTSTGRISIVIE